MPRGVPLQRLLLYVGGMAVCESLLLKLEYISRAEMHSAYFYTVAVFGTLGIVTALGVASRHRWGCTMLTGVYTLFGLAFLWILPLFPAEPKLGPVYQPGDPFHPVGIPAARHDPGARDRPDPPADRSRGARSSGRSSPGSAFFVTFVAVQWPFANFLMSPLAAQLVLRHRLHGLQHAADVPLRPLRVHSA